MLVFDTASWLTVASPTLTWACAGAEKKIATATIDASAAHRAVNEDPNRNPPPTLATSPPRASHEDSSRIVGGDSNFIAKAIHAFVRDPRYW